MMPSHYYDDRTLAEKGVVIKDKPMTQDLKTRIENIYALNRERTQGTWKPHEYLARKGGKSEDNEVVMIWTDLPGRTVAECVLRKNSKFLAAAPEMVDIIRSLEAKVEEQGLWLDKLADSLQNMVSSELMIKSVHERVGNPYLNVNLEKAEFLLAGYKLYKESK